MSPEFVSVGSPVLWMGFIVFLLAMLALDLGVFHKSSHTVSLKEAGIWSAVWVLMALGFAVGVHVWFGSERALEFTTGYLLEKALAVDNIFVFLVIFATFRIPMQYQHRVLFWGVLVALILRAVFIFAGAALLQRFHWMLYLFGGFLALTGVKLLLQRQHDDGSLEEGRVMKLFRRMMPTTTLHGDKFVVLQQGRWHATPLLLALIAVEVSDVIFALDSIPAIFAVTTDPFIVFTSNIFAIMGLRSLYFLLSGVVSKFVYLKVGLALVLVFVGLKMLLVSVVKVPILVSLLVIAALLAGSMLLSLLPSAQARVKPIPAPDAE